MPELCTDVLQVISEDEVEKFHDIFTKDWPLSSYVSIISIIWHIFQNI